MFFIFLIYLLHVADGFDLFGVEEDRGGFGESSSGDPRSHCTAKLHVGKGGKLHTQRKGLQKRIRFPSVKTPLSLLIPFPSLPL